MQIQHDFPLTDVLWYKIGGTAKYLLTCVSREDIHEALAFVKEHNPKRVFICGLGSNLVFSDNYFDGVVIRIVSSEKKDIVRNETTITAFAGLLLDDVITFAFTNGLIGIAWAGGLPGTVGAAVRGNVGAYGGEMKDILVSAEVIDYSGDKPILKIMTNEELQFVYRGSFIKSHNHLLVVSATFAFKEATAEELAVAKTVYEQNKQNRRERHPLEYPNCGSVFKNLKNKEEIKKVLTVYPDLQELVEKKWFGKIAVASIIEKFGLKGYQIGDAQISEKHALFIINKGHAKAKEVLQIIQTVKNKFHEVFGFEPEVEVEIVS